MSDVFIVFLPTCFEPGASTSQQTDDQTETQNLIPYVLALKP